MACISNLLDTSQKHINPSLINNSNKKYFLTFQHENCIESSDSLIKQANNLKYFDECILEKKSNIIKDNEFCKQLKNDKFNFTFNNEKGCGFYLWKPYIIYKHLKNINEGDYIVYSDPGGKFPTNPILICWAKNKLTQYLNTIQANKGCLCFDTGYVQYVTTKFEIFKHFNLHCDFDFYNSNSKTSCLHFIRKCPYTMKVYESWWNCAKQNPFLFNDCICKYDIVKNFIEPRNEQSIWSAICYVMDVDLCEDNPSKRPIRISSRPLTISLENAYN